MSCPAVTSHPQRRSMGVRLRRRGAILLAPALPAATAEGLTDRIRELLVDALRLDGLELASIDLSTPLLGDGLVGLRVRGLWAGLDLDPALGTGRDLCEVLVQRGVLVKDTHGSTIRVSPPLTIERSDLEWGLGQVRDAVAGLANGHQPRS